LAESVDVERPRIRPLAYVEVELGLCEHCRQDVRAHATDGRCSTAPRRGRPSPRHYYRGRRTGAFMDLGSPEYAAAMPDPKDRRNFELFLNNPSGGVGL